MTDGIAVGAALVSYTSITADACDCTGVCDWTHSAMLCSAETEVCQLNVISVPRKTTELQRLGKLTTMLELFIYVSY